MSAEPTRYDSLVRDMQTLYLVARHFPEGEAQGDKVAYVSGQQLEAWLLRQPARLSPRDQQLIKLGLEAEVRATGVSRRMPTWRPDQCARYIKRRTAVAIGEGSSLRPRSSRR